MTTMKTSCFFFIFISSSIAADTVVNKFTEATFALEYNRFTINTYKHVAKTEEGNFLISPFFGETMLSLVQSGSRGKNSEEIEKILPRLSSSTIQEITRKLLETFKDKKSYDFRAATKMYIKEGFSVKSNFWTLAKNIYQTDIQNINYTETEAASSINGWFKDSVDHEFKNLIESNLLDDHTKILLVNALFFKANWSIPFPRHLSGKRKFYFSKKNFTYVDTMSNVGIYKTYDRAYGMKARSIELFFRNKEVSMILLVPYKWVSLSDIEDELESTLGGWRSPRNVSLTLPKFRIESLIDMINPFLKLGVHKVLSPLEADLSGVAHDNGDFFYIDGIFQKAFIDVSDEGVESDPGETLINSGVEDGHYITENFVVDRSFVFFLKIKNVIVFAGRVTDPSKF